MKKKKKSTGGYRAEDGKGTGWRIYLKKKKLSGWWSRTGGGEEWRG